MPKVVNNKSRRQERKPKDPLLKSEGKFPNDKKELLISLVGNNPCLWDFSHKEHRTSTAQSAAWDKIAWEIDEPMINCKKTWKSLRTSWKYHNSKKSQIKSEIEDDTDSDQIDPNWQYWEDMKFLKDGENRTTISDIGNDAGFLEPLTDSSSESEAPVSPAFSMDSIVSNYQNATKTKSKKTDSAENLSKAVQALIKIKQQRIEQNKTSQPSLKYLSMYLNLDRMWSKLPEDTVEDLNLRIIQLTRDEMKAQIEKMKI